MCKIFPSFAGVADVWGTLPTGLSKRRRHARAANAPELDPKSIDFRKMEVLLVEDDYHTREMVKQVLKQVGIKNGPCGGERP